MLLFHCSIVVLLKSIPTHTHTHTPTKQHFWKNSADLIWQTEPGSYPVWTGAVLPGRGTPGQFFLEIPKIGLAIQQAHLQAPSMTGSTPKMARKLHFFSCFTLENLENIIVTKYVNIHTHNIFHVLPSKSFEKKMLF